MAENDCVMAAFALSTVHWPLMLRFTYCMYIVIVIFSVKMMMTMMMMVVVVIIISRDYTWSAKV